jgi:hydrogenase nickel incorporation protein HypA/HybF
MHELGLMQSAIEEALRQARGAGATRVLHLVLNIGAASGANPEVLRIGFAAITQGTPAENATLEIVITPVCSFCRRCQIEFEPACAEDLYYACPQCAAFDTEIRRGRDILVDALEVST